jgi:Tat protein translocase TatB subunit
MFNLSGEKIMVIFAVALVVLGPDHLPVAVRRVGQIMGQLRDISESFKREVSQALDDPGEPIVKPMSRPPLSAVPEVEAPTPNTPVEPESNEALPLPPDRREDN